MVQLSFEDPTEQRATGDPKSPEEDENVGEFVGQFDEHWRNKTLRLENDSRMVIKQGPDHGIVFSRTPLNETCPYIRFKVRYITVTVIGYDRHVLSWIKKSIRGTSGQGKLHAGTPRYLW